jgi:hypothetical protein
MCKITKTTLRSDRTRCLTFKRNINARGWANQVTSRNVSQRGAFLAGSWSVLGIPLCGCVVIVATCGACEANMTKCEAIMTAVGRCEAIVFTYLQLCPLWGGVRQLCRDVSHMWRM